MAGRRQRSAAVKARKVIANTADISMSRPRREATEEMTRASLSREPPSSPSNNGSLRLTVKASSSKLKAATSMKPSGTRGVAQPVNVNSRDKFVGGEILDGKRSRNVKKSYVVESDSEAEDEEMEDVEDDDVVEEDAEDDDVVEEDAIGSDEDADDDADGDVNMDAHPPAPRIRTSNEGTAKPTIHVRPQPAKKDVRTVEQKETADSDDELSELESGMEDETMQVDEEEDAEGDEEEIEVEDEVDEDEEDLDSDDGTPAGASRGSTPDLSKLTRRQRARFEEGGSGHLMALPDEVQVKKHLTAEEHAMRRAEMARRRKNLSEKRNEEEKMDTINKLLKKQAPKTNARRKDLAGPSASDNVDGEPAKPEPIFVRWVSNKDGNQINIPEEMIDSPVGVMFKPGVLKTGKMVEEVQ